MVQTSTVEANSLLRLASQGDARARSELLARYRPRLKRMVAMRMDRRIAARLDPSDIVQEAMTVAHERLPDYLADPQLSFYPWLRRITWDRLIDSYRTHISAERRSVLAEDHWELGVNDESVVELAHGVAASSIMPIRKAMNAELEHQIAECLRQLKSHDREVLVLRFLEQLSVPEIATIFEISETAVTSRTLRALKRLRQQLRKVAGDLFP
jgi:RNA polymerase sigma-70 factor (ECF subfamily)